MGDKASMVHYAFLSVLLAISFVDILFHQSLSVAPMALLYTALKLQADRAAEIFLKHGLIKPVADTTEPSWMPPPEKDPFATPLKEPLRLESPEAPKEEAKKPEEPRARKPPAPKPRELYRAPKFHGAPHEVLGIESDANTSVIVKAFRHWIKEFHPDHLKPGQEMRRATDRARTLTSAKESLLDRRRQMRKAA